MSALLMHASMRAHTYNPVLAILAAGFLAPQSSFGSGANKLGITQANWQTCANGYSACSEPFGACTTVANGSAYDQFSAYRDATAAKLSPMAASINCSFLWNDVFSASYGSYWATWLSCDYGGGSVGVNMNVIASQLNLTYGCAGCLCFPWLARDQSIQGGGMVAAFSNASNISIQPFTQAVACASWHK